ncbi:MAG: hypothetical protein HQM08_03020 [Candidatus Riflebacteria bacterium]|nr:hypothetical protein [Candidatus Riflebacteria bacterium]
MNTQKRTLITFVAFAINYYLIMLAHRGTLMTLEQNVLVWLVFVTFCVFSYIAWDISFLFGAMASLYVFFLVFKSVFSFYTIVSVLVISTMYFLLFREKISLEVSLPNWKKLAAIYSAKSLKERIKKIAGVKAQGCEFGENQIERFSLLESEVKRINGFFDGSDTVLEESVFGTKKMIGDLLKDYCRLILRESHLKKLINNSGKANLQKEKEEISQKIQNENDLVAKEEMRHTLEMKGNRITEVEKLETCLGREMARKTQIEEIVFSTYNRLNSLKFSDIQTLDSSLNLLDSQVQLLRDELDETANSIILVEKQGLR